MKWRKEGNDLIEAWSKSRKKAKNKKVEELEKRGELRNGWGKKRNEGENVNKDGRNGEKIEGW